MTYIFICKEKTVTIILRILGVSVQYTVAGATKHPGWTHLTDQQ